MNNISSTVARRKQRLNKQKSARAAHSKSVHDLKKGVRAKTKAKQHNIETAAQRYNFANIKAQEELRAEEERKEQQGKAAMAAIKANAKNVVAKEVKQTSAIAPNIPPVGD